MVGIKNNGSIRMLEEHVFAKVPECRVKVTFVFNNEGPATTAVMIFPESGGYAAYTSRRDPDARKKTHFKYFHSWVDGKAVKVKRRLHDKTFEDGYNYTNWWVKKVHFNAGQTRTIVDEYQGEPGWAGTGYPDTETFNYILQTGGSWKGSIGSGTIQIDCRNLMNRYQVKCMQGAFMKPIKVVSGVANIRFRDLKPTDKDDVQVWWTKKGSKKMPPED